MRAGDVVKREGHQKQQGIQGAFTARTAMWMAAKSHTPKYVLGLHAPGSLQELDGDLLPGLHVQS